MVVTPSSGTTWRDTSAAGRESGHGTRTQPAVPRTRTTPRRARGHVAAYLTAAGRSDLIPSATLIVSELVTNAVVHAGGTIDLRVALTDESLRVDIHDTSDLLPHLRQPDVGGRGLHIVNAIATNWGVTTDGHGKTTWFELRLTDSRTRDHLSLMPAVLPPYCGRGRGGRAWRSTPGRCSAGPGVSAAPRRRSADRDRPLRRLRWGRSSRTHRGPSFGRRRRRFVLRARLRAALPDRARRASRRTGVERPATDGRELHERVQLPDGRRPRCPVTALARPGLRREHAPDAVHPRRRRRRARRAALRGALRPVGAGDARRWPPAGSPPARSRLAVGWALVARTRRRGRLPALREAAARARSTAASSSRTTSRGPVSPDRRPATPIATG